MLIKNTKIVDGTGKASFPGSIAIQGEKIVAVGKVMGDASVIIDGSGLVTCPGFIDSHSHAEHDHNETPSGCKPCHAGNDHLSGRKLCHVACSAEEPYVQSVALIGRTKRNID